MEDELNLRQYISALIKHRWLIVATTVLAALAAFAVSLINAPLSNEPLYEATAGVLIARMRTSVTFDSRFRTIEELPGSNYLEQDAHRTALASLVKNGRVATLVSERIENELGLTDWPPARLLTVVSSRAIQAEEDELNQPSTRPVTSDLIEIKVRFADPDQAAWIANAWAEAYVEHVNALFRVDAESLNAVQNQLDDAYQTYKQAEQALLDFVADNQISDLERRIATKQALIDGLQANQQATYLEALNTERLKLGQHYTTTRKLELLLENAKSLRNQIQQGGVSNTATNELALVLLKAQAFAGSETLPANLELQIILNGDESPDIADQIAEVDALIKTLEERIAETEAAIEKQADRLSNAARYTKDDSPTFDETVTGLQDDERQLQVLLAQERAREKELIRARDLAWDTYSTLEVKAAELRIAAEIADIEVRFASPAVAAIPANSYDTPSRLIRNVGMAAILGLMLGIGTALFLQYYDPTIDLSIKIETLFKRHDTKNGKKS
jgi:uncharacterized protein involved in exopolysaccharide biosynthesis